MNMSNLYSYFVNPKTISYIASEYVDNNNIDVSNQQTVHKIQMVVKKVLDDTFNLLDKSKIQKNNVNDAIEKFVNVAMKRLQLPPRQRNMAAPVSMRMPPQHSTNTRLEEDSSIENRTSKYMQEYREFNNNSKPGDVPDWLRSQNTNPKRMIEEQQKKMSAADMFKNTSTRKSTQQFNDSQAYPSNDIEDFGGSSNFSYFNDTPEITSAFDDAFYNTGIDPDSVGNEISETLEERLKKIESTRNQLKVPEKKLENIEELFQNDNEFKKHVNMTNKNFHRNPQDEQIEQEQNRNKFVSQSNKNQQLMGQPNRMHPGIENMGNMHNQQQSQQSQQAQQDIQQLISRFSLKENQYQEQITLLRGKMGKYEEYLKTLMDKYVELKGDRDLLKERFKQNNLGGSDTGNKYILDTIEEKKRELLRMSADVQEKIARLEQLQENSNN